MGAFQKGLQAPEVQQQLRNLEQNAGITLDDIERAVVGITEIEANKQPDAVIVVRFKKPVDQNRIVRGFNGQKKAHQGADYYSGLNGAKGCLYFPGADMLVITSTEPMMTDEVISSDGVIRFSPELQELFHPIEQHQIWGATLVNAELRAKIEIPAEQRNMLKIFAPKADALVEFLPKANGFAGYINDDGAETKIGLGMKLRNANEIDEFLKVAKEAVPATADQLMLLGGLAGQNIPADVKKLVKNSADNAKTEKVGDVGYIVISLDDQELNRLAEQNQQP